MRYSATGLLVLCLITVAGCGGIGDRPAEVGLYGTIEAPPEHLPKTANVWEIAPQDIDRLDKWFQNPAGTGIIRLLGKSETVNIQESKFAADFETWFSYAFLIIPPLGAIPDHPPAPAFAIHFVETPEEIYFVRLVDSKLEYVVYDVNTRLKKEPAESYWRIEGQKYEASEFADPKNTGVKEIWYVHSRWIWNQANRSHSPTPSTAHQVTESRNPAKKWPTAIVCSMPETIFASQFRRIAQFQNAAGMNLMLIENPTLDPEGIINPGKVI